jgi:soluble lytic murein transglycosylase-like protein
MTFSAIIISAAKSVGISANLLLAICTVESNLTNVLVMHDGGSPSVGICQIKKTTAFQMGFRGKLMDLMNPYANAKYSALYLKYQLDRYNGDVVKAISAYNAGTYNESKNPKSKGKPRNLKYVHKVMWHYTQISLRSKLEEKR